MPEVDTGEDRSHLVGVDSSDLKVQPRNGHGIGADAAAEVEHLTKAGRAEPTRMACCDLKPRGLFEAIGGEQHPGGEVAELLGAFGSQPGLRQRRCHQVDVEPGHGQSLAEREGEGLVIRG